MESALVSLILMTALLFSVLTLADNYFTTQDTLRAAHTRMEMQRQERAETALGHVQTEVISSGSILEITIRNEGTSKLVDFDQWDLIIQYYNEAGLYAVQWLPYVASVPPDNNEWAVAGLYQTAASLTTEVYEPGILNPGEEMVLQAKLLPPIGSDTTNMATIATANGYRLTVLFTY